MLSANISREAQVAYGPFRYCFVDESVQSSSGFTVTAFVFDPGGMPAAVGTALKRAGLRAGIDEHKSGERMEGDPVRQGLRAELLGLVTPPVRFAVLCTPSSAPERLEAGILQCLDLILRKNGIFDTLDVFFDQGLVSSNREMRVLPGHDTVTLHPEQDSRRVLGIQVADLVAHTVGQVLKHRLTKLAAFKETGHARASKEIPFRTPHGDELKVDLDTFLLRPMRWAFFHRPYIYLRQRNLWGPETDPEIIPDGYPPFDSAKYVRLLGWGMFLATDLPPDMFSDLEHEFTILARLIAWSPCE